MRVIAVAGARPNFIKVKPVVDALEQRSVEVVLVHTGQHYDAAMSDVFFEELELRQPDVHLAVGSGSHAEQTAATMVRFEPVVTEHRPDAVVVAGDVNSTLACALVGAKSGSIVAHVEAGLRSRDWSMPEEINRVATDRVSDLLFAPSPDAVDNLRAEGYRSDQVSLAGNVMIDTLLANLERARARNAATRLDLDRGGYILVTLHRPANVDDADRFAATIAALEAAATRLPVVLPAHPRVADRVRSLAGAGTVRVIEPVSYLDSISLQLDAAVVLTDSGGIQEETTALGIPCLTYRDNTERPVTVTEGTNRVIGTDPSRIGPEIEAVLDRPREPRCPALWDGRASERIATRIVEVIRDDRWPRPSELTVPVAP